MELKSLSIELPWRKYDCILISGCQDKIFIFDIIALLKYSICLQPPYRFAAEYKNPCWREKGTMRMRCLPYFFLIGVMKCGSSMLWEYIKYHPDFALPVFRKESQWFAKKRFSGYFCFTDFKWKRFLSTYGNTW